MIKFQNEKIFIKDYFKKKIIVNKKYYSIYVKIKSNNLFFFKLIKIIEISKNIKINKKTIIKDLFLPYLYFFIIENYNKDKLYILKKVNSFFKLVDRFEINSNFKKEKIVEALNWIIEIKLNTLTNFKHRNAKLKQGAPIKKDLVILFYDNPIARAYLECMKSFNYEPTKIIHLVSKNNLETGKNIYKYFPASLKYILLQNNHFYQMNYWPNILKKKYKKIYDLICGEINRKFNFEKSIIDNATKKINLTYYSNKVQKVYIDSLNDINFINHMSTEDINNVYLFTGGGRFPINKINNKFKILHIHPGFLPEIKGSDGFFWSILKYGSPSVSSFLLDQNLDSGRIINREILKQFRLPFQFNELSIKNKYRFIYSFIDPWIRAYELKRLVLSQSSFNNYFKQEKNNDSNTFYFMHNYLKDQILKKILL